MGFSLTTQPTDPFLWEIQIRLFFLHLSDLSCTSDKHRYSTFSSKTFDDFKILLCLQIFICTVYNAEFALSAKNFCDRDYEIRYEIKSTVIRN